MSSESTPSIPSRPHLVLVGMMGAGKTSGGRRVAKRLHRRHVDLDAAIERTFGRKIPEIFAAEGEPGFRDREHDVLVDLLRGDEPLVVSTGGGAVLREDNRASMRERGTVVWLRAAPQTLLSRVGDGSGRPLLAGDPLGNLTRLAAARADAYRAAAHHIVDVDHMSFDAITTGLAALVAGPDPLPENAATC
ncbi:MAG: shikimate kinase, partial [Actinobacteria bacterium]|nr:shikimate kinase [Actinomycetota bacterium]